MAERTGRRKARQTFEEDLTVEFVLATPEGIDDAEVARVFARAAWRFEVELAINVFGRLTAARIPKPPSIEDGWLEWHVEADFDLALSPWEEIDPDHYSRSDTLGTFRAEADLPDGWEITEQRLSSY